MSDCPKCLTPDAEFGKDASRPNKLSRNCKTCNRTRSLAHYYRTTEVQRSRQLKRHYGITAAEFDIMLANQGGCCAICGTTNPGGKGAFHVDHCHETGTVRGLLCQQCNMGLGHFQDNTQSLAIAIYYLVAA